MKVLGTASRHQIFFVGILLTYLILATGTAITRQPYSDEGYLASPAYTLVHRGYMAVIPSDQHRDSHKAYWMPPVFFLVQAAWQSVVGFGVVQFRLGSVVAGLVLLFAIHYVVSRLSDDRTLALIIMSLVALDYTFVQHAGIGRPEMMSSAFAVCSLAAHLALRQRYLGLALLASHALMATSALTHPIGALLWMPALLGLQAYLDLKQLRLTSLLLIALPYLVGGAAWSLYILDDPNEFRSQLSGMALGSNRFAGLQDPFRAVPREVVDRFLGYYGVRPNASFLVKLKLVLPVGYVMGILAALVVPVARRSRFVRMALLLSLVQFLTLAVFEGTKQYHYILHIIPAFLGVLGAVLWLGWQHAWIPRVMLAAVAFPAASQSSARPRPPGTTALEEPPPPPLVATDPSFEPQVIVRTEGDQTIQEYRVKGKLYMQRVTPKHGKSYILMDHKGDGTFMRQDNPLDNGVRVPQWVLLEF